MTLIAPQECPQSPYASLYCRNSQYTIESSCKTLIFPVFIDLIYLDGSRCLISNINQQIVLVQKMGASKSKVKKTVETEKIDINHPRLKNVIYKQNEGQETIETDFSLHNKADYQNWANNLTRDPGMGSRDVLAPIKHEFKQSKMCGSGGKANIVYDNFPYLLSNEIKNRRDHNNPKFGEHQLWYLLQTMGNVGQLYHRNGQKVGDISPDNTFMNEDGEIKLASKNSWPGEKTNYERAFFEKDVAYLAPEEVQDLNIGRNKPENDFQKAQSFSAGLTALDAALLDNSQKLYGKKYDFNHDLLKEKKEKLLNEPQYSNLLKGTILNLTELNPNKRMTLTKLKNWLQPYAGNLQEFRPSYLPPELQETLSQNSTQGLNFPNQSQNNYQGANFQSQQRNSYSNSIPTFGESRRQTFISRESNPIEIPRQATIPIISNQRITTSSEMPSSYRDSFPENRGSNQFVPNQRQSGNQLNQQMKNDLDRKLIEGTYQESKPGFENEPPQRPTMMERIKQVPTNIAHQFHSSKSPHFNRERIHSMSPSQKENPPRYGIPERRYVVQGNTQINSQPRQNYQNFNPPVFQDPRNVIQRGNFHSPPARPSSFYQPEQTFFQRYANQNQQPVSHPQFTQASIPIRTMPGNSYYRKQQIPGGTRIESGSIETRRLDGPGGSNTNTVEKRQYSETIQRSSTYSPNTKIESNYVVPGREQSSYNQQGSGKTSLELIEQKIKNSRRNFPAQ